MPRNTRRGQPNDDEKPSSRHQPRRTRVLSVEYADEDEDRAPMDVDEEESDENHSASKGSDDEDDDEDDDDDDDEEEEDSGRKRPASKGRSKDSKSDGGDSGPRKSSRRTKFVSSMEEPTEKSILMYADDTPPSRKRKKEGDHVQDSLGKISANPSKSPARRHARKRLSISRSDANDDESDDFLDVSDDEEEEEEDDSEPLKIQRILATRTETRGKWREICKNMNTSEIDFGSRWFQRPGKDDANSDDVFEERFLVKWADLSYMHCSWETQDDLVEQVETAKASFRTFFRKSTNGLLFSSDERCDGDYYDPAFCEVERILEIELPEDQEPVELTPEKEDSFTSQSFGIVMDKTDEKFEDGTGRQFLVKWGNTPYSDATFEFERDLILNDIEYKEQVKSFLRRRRKPTRSEKKALLKKGDAEQRKLYKIFGDRSDIDDVARQKLVEEYQGELQKLEFKNGGSLRDYQAEGVSWMLANFVNDRSSILADEMGLGKTLQTVATMNQLLRKLNRGGPVLVVAPLSTLAHWHREFRAWTDLNAIIYHGSAEDRQHIRELEMAYESDRPQTALGFNQLYLKKCLPKRSSKDSRRSLREESPWMIEVVITTPELLVADDFVELSAVEWEVLVVDEAHRLKNQNSKLGVNLRDDRFTFRHKVLLTGTPIQNDVQEFWTLLNFVDPDTFDDDDDFNERYGDMKEKETVDSLHEEIRPYILRRLKEDVEKSVPPKEETLIEVELTVSQKQYYRALYEKNVKFLLKNKNKALDGPSLNNLSMQLRKCCNHIFLLNGVEEDVRSSEVVRDISEGDFLVKGSGKLVLLDKLLPRLKEEGHRVLVFSQFKIMLDILEDYLIARSMKFERIDGSITGNKRQQSIDRFQSPAVAGKEAPFIMLLSTRAGGVGINLTAADTCIIFDSDFNPQNDLQAQARCHRIGQTKSVKIYRLLTRNTYEQQMFHISSLKLGLDQAVLHGFESGASGEGALSKEEVEKLLRHGAYDMFNEEKDGTAEAASNDFQQQDIDSIMQRRSKTIVHDSAPGAGSAAGSTFSKARFQAAKSPESSKNKSKREDVEINDPDFWKKMLGDAAAADVSEDLTNKRRQRTQANYSDQAYRKQLEAALQGSDEDESDGESTDEDDQQADPTEERSRWGGPLDNQWKKDDAENIIRTLSVFGYGILPAEDFVKKCELKKSYELAEVRRMSWALVLATALDVAADEVEIQLKKEERASEKERDTVTNGKESDGGVLAGAANAKVASSLKNAEFLQDSFDKLWKSNLGWIQEALTDAVEFAKTAEPREQAVLDKIVHGPNSKPPTKVALASKFAESVWPSLKSRDWKSSFVTDGDLAGKTVYTYDAKEYSSPEAVISAALQLHPELSNMLEPIMKEHKESQQQEVEASEEERLTHLAMQSSSLHVDKLEGFLSKYAPLQLVADRLKEGKNNRLRLPRKLLSHCSFLHNAEVRVTTAGKVSDDASVIDRIAATLPFDKKTTRPHPQWSVKHDAVLIYAIAKHGWIDHDASCRSIIDDSSIKWGSPFDAGAATDTPAPLLDDGRAKFLRDTAARAASFLNENSDLLSELVGFNKPLVVTTYGLIQEPDAVPSKWIVDQDALQASCNLGGNSSTRDPEELPPKRDLVKRAKHVLKDGPGEKKPESKTSHGFSVLDQSNSCNVLLAEVLRAVLKTSMSKSNFVKTLCALATRESKTLFHSSIASGALRRGSGDGPKAADEYGRVHGHLELVEKTVSKNATQAKNVVRVILGEEPQKLRNSGDTFFPVQKVRPLKLSAPAKGANSNTKQAKKPTSANPLPSSKDKTSAEKSIEQARKRHTESKDRSLLGESDTSVLQLTEVETQILSVVCTYGMPNWTDQWHQALTSSSTGDSGGLTWSELGTLVSAFALRQVKKGKDKVLKLRKDTSSNTSKARLREAESSLKVLESAAGTSAEYASEPENLSKKVIMLLAKIRHVVEDPRAKDQSHKLVRWLGKDIDHWARCLELMDANGRALAFTAIDFAYEMQESQLAELGIVSVFDKRASLAVVSQIASLSRLRWVLSSCEGDMLGAMIEQAKENLQYRNESWAKEPAWWASGVGQYDEMLLRRLSENGFSDELLQDITDHGLVGEYATFSYRHLHFSKSTLQARANQLLLEIHAIQEGATLSKTSASAKSSAKTSAKKSKPEGSNQVIVIDSPGAESSRIFDVEVASPPSKEKRKLQGGEASIAPDKKQRPW